MARDVQKAGGMVVTTQVSEPSSFSNPVKRPTASEPNPEKPRWVVDDTLHLRTQSYREFAKENGRVSFHCGGRIMMSPGVLFPLLITTPLIVVPSMAHFIFNEQPWYVLVVTVGCMVAVLTCLYLTTFRDPGFIPRGPTPADEPPNNTAVRNPIDGKLWKWCSTCKIWRPPRSKHCRTTNACVRTFDHYCPWMGNAIGERNYIPFYSFVTLVMVYAVIIMAEVLTSLSEGEFEKFGIWMGLAIFCASVITLTMCLCVSLSCNVANGLTTNEVRLGRHENKNNKGWYANITSMLSGSNASQLTY